MSVFLMVGLWNVLTTSNAVMRNLQGPGLARGILQDIRGTNIQIQLRFYQILTKMRPNALNPRDITLVYIDDDAHWNQLAGVTPTSRAFLASLVKSLSDTVHARVIGLDIALLAERPYGDGVDSPARIGENKDLLNAIHQATRSSVPVVLGGAYYVRNGHPYRVSSLFSDSDLMGDTRCKPPMCPAYGYIEGPDDRRLIPLMATVQSSDGSMTSMPSFALAVAAAAIRTSRDKPSNPPLPDPAEPVYGTFVQEDRFNQISALDLLANTKNERSSCAGQIVLIGSHWHELEGYGSLVDSHLSPAGTLSGLSFHGNYIEALLADKWAREIPTWLNLLIDLVVGISIYAAFALTLRLRNKVITLAVAMCLPIIGAWLALVAANRYFDFFLPIELYFLHVLYEFISESWHLWRRGAQHDRPQPAGVK